MNIFTKMFSWLPGYHETEREKVSGFCGWKKIAEGIEQSKGTLVDIADKARVIVSFSNKIIKVVSLFLPVKYVRILKIFPEFVELTSMWGAKIINGEATAEEAEHVLNVYLGSYGVDSKTIKHFFHFVAGMITKKLKGE